jgi:hypothetical protein
MLATVKPSLDVADRVVYRAFEVPDLLTPEHQLRAAGAALLRRCLSNRVADDDYSESAIMSNLYLYQVASTYWIEAAASELRQAAFDPLLGRYQEEPDQSPTSTEEALRNAIFGHAEERRAGEQGGELTGNLGRALAREIVLAVIETAGARDALREARLDLEAGRTPRDW